jgi:hypothetical protein
MLKTYKLKDGSMQKSTFWINKNQNSLFCAAKETIF